MKQLVYLALSTLILISCGGRNASEIYDSGGYQFQKPSGGEEWISLVGALLLNDHLIKLDIQYYNTDEGSWRLDVFIDEAAKTVRAFVDGSEVQFGDLKCLKEVQSLCHEYEITSRYKNKYLIQKLEPLKVSSHSTAGNVQTVWPMTLIQQQDVIGNRNYVATQVPSTSTLIYLNQVIYFPNLLSTATALSFGLPGILPEANTFYRFLYFTEVVGTSETILYGKFEHILTGQQETVEWHMLK